MKYAFGAATAALMAAALLATPASAATTSVTFAAPGVQPTIHFIGFEPGTQTADNGLTADLTLTLAGFSADHYRWDFTYTLVNTSTDAARFATIGWDIDQAFQSVSGVTGTFTDASSGNLSSLGHLDFCLKSSNGANCSGGSNGGLAAGASGSGSFSLTFASSFTSFIQVQQPVYNNRGRLIRYDTVNVPVVNPIAAPTSLTFDNFGTHIQSLAGGGSTVGVPGDLPPPVVIDPPTDTTSVRAVPEPATWATMILGFFCTGALIRRRRFAIA